MESIRVCVWVSAVAMHMQLEAAAAAVVAAHTKTKSMKKRYIRSGCLIFALLFFRLFFCLNWSKHNLMMAPFSLLISTMSWFARWCISLILILSAFAALYSRNWARWLVDDGVAKRRPAFDGITTAIDVHWALNVSCEPRRNHFKLQPHPLTFDVCPVHCEHAHCLRSTALRLGLRKQKKRKYTRIARYWHRLPRCRCRRRGRRHLHFVVPEFNIQFS